jgi:hypothetical protein
LVHSGILSQCAELSRCIEWEGIPLSDTDPAIFELVLSFLYTGDYRYYSSSTIPRPQDGHTKAWELEKHSLLYCFASRYKLDRLLGLTIENIEGMRRVAYVSVLDAARKMYHKLPEDDRWYRDYFKNETRNALRENMDLVQESWILDVFREEKGRLTVDLFTTLTDGARSEDTAQDSVPTTVLTPTTSAFNHTPCEHRKKHLTSLKGDGPWKQCPTCHYERDQMMTTGRAIVSVVFADIWPSFSQDISSKPDTDPPKRRKKDRKKLRRALTEAVCHLPVDRVTGGILAEDGYEQCPDQAEHLKKQDGKWLWQSCSRCLCDRQLIFDKLRELGISEGFSALFGFGSASESNAKHIATPSTEVHNQHMDSTTVASVEGSVAAETPECDMVIVEEFPQFEDCPKAEPGAVPVDYETVVEETVADVLEEPPQEIILDDEWADCFFQKKKDKKRRKHWIEDAPPEPEPVAEDDSPPADPCPEPVAEDDPPPADPCPEPVAEDDPPPADPCPEPAPEPEPELNAWGTWGTWGIPSNNSKKGKKGKGIPSSTFSLDPWGPFQPPPEISKHGYAELPRFTYNAFVPIEKEPPPPEEFVAGQDPTPHEGFSVEVDPPLPADEEKEADPHPPPEEEREADPPSPAEEEREADPPSPAEEEREADPPPPADEEKEPEPEPREDIDDDIPCQRRRRHLADESRWMQCGKCRKEMAVYARRLVRQRE